ncbi:hypothetical protein SLITO_v1c10460 [Spiroplasma litorale]|uniref:DUF3137 domain-containing protein n=1 Tax=Spiroplasma litorale TaxID=216942 RepID=A0A0K1W3H3_9MOLU|nr:hypothetical protein [Spiroplasma litorale]AKX34657.1 hypothetical protein SLITO_v1c10460 [Spiroplasma litorale]
MRKKDLINNLESNDAPSFLYKEMERVKLPIKKSIWCSLNNKYTNLILIILTIVMLLIAVLIFTVTWFITNIDRSLSALYLYLLLGPEIFYGLFFLYFFICKINNKKIDLKISNISWNKVFELYIKNDKLKISNIDIITASLELYNLLTMLNNNKTYDINNKINFVFKDFDFKINFNNIYYDKEEQNILLRQEIIFNERIPLDDILNEFKSENYQNVKSHKIDNNICLTMNVLIMDTTNKLSKKGKITPDSFIKENINFNECIFGLYGQKNYNKNNRAKVFEEMVKKDSNIIKNIIENL